MLTDPLQVLRNSKVILLVDWANPEIPHTLLKAGFTVFCYSPDRYSLAELASEPSSTIEDKNLLLPKSGDDKRGTVFRKLDGNPGSVDIVNTYRPQEELSGIMEKHVLPLKAKTLWIQPPIISAWARKQAAVHGLVFIEGSDISEIALSLSS